MDPLSGLFALALYKATETVWAKVLDKGFDAAWAPLDESLKARFGRWAGKSQARERRAAFAAAVRAARERTLRQATDRAQAERILDLLDDKLDRRVADAFAEEAARLMLFSAVPDVPRLSELCRRNLAFQALASGEQPPSPDTIAVTLSDFLTNLREALLDQEAYRDLVQHDIRRILNEILAEERPIPYDEEPTYRAQMAELHRELGFVGIPELKERRSITVEDIFVRLRAERETVEIESDPRIDQGAARLEISTGITAVGEVTNVSLLHSENAPVDSLLQRMGRGGRRATKQQVNLDEALCESEHLIILGDPGAGKTTLLKYLTVVCAEGRAADELKLQSSDGTPLLPVFVILREFAAEAADRSQDYGLLDYLYTYARERPMLNLRRSFFEDALSAGRSLVCLDGLDEIWAPGRRKAVCDAIRALAARFPRSRYVVTSRIVGYEEAPLDRRNFTHYTVLPLADEDIREFVRRWHALRERDPVRRRQQTDDLIATIERQPRIQTLARNPLLLTIIALVHRIEAELPHERVKLYDKCVTALVETWEEVKGLTIEEKQRPFYRTRRRLLERLAYELHTRAEKPGQVQTIKEGDLERLLAHLIMANKRLGLADDPDPAREEACAFVRLVRSRTGLLVERGEGIVGFSHLTFQEYLAACDIKKRCDLAGAEALWGAIKDRLHDPHWREVILLLLGSLNDSDELPTELVERILATGKDDKFEPVLHRHLYLAARALADKVDVAAGLKRRIVDALLAIACGKWPWKSAAAFAALGRLEGNDYATAGLLALARDRQLVSGIRWRAVEALLQLRRFPDAAEVLVLIEVVQELIDLMQVEGVTISFAFDTRLHPGAVIKALGQLARTDPQVLGWLIRLARDLQIDNWVRFPSIRALGQLGQEDVLVELACDEHVDVRSRLVAARELGQRRRPELVIKVLLALAQDTKLDRPDDQRSAILVLVELRQTEEWVLDKLLALANDSLVYASVRVEAAKALGLLGRPELAAKVLLELLQIIEGTWARKAAIEALGQLGRADALVVMVC